MQDDTQSQPEQTLGQPEQTLGQPEQTPDSSTTSTSVEHTASASSPTAATERAPGETQHIYYQLAGDLLSKPRALCQVIEAAGRPATIVFCNLPSDTDMVEAFLRKAGIPCQKIIGNVPDSRVTKSVKSAQNGEIVALVVTDIGARTIEVEELDLVINYSIPDDPEIYIHRMGRTGNGGRLGRILSFVSPLDISNFHYLKKFCGSSFVEGTLPSEEDLSLAQIDQLARRATQAPAGEKSGEVLVNRVLEHPASKDIVALLLHSFLHTLPELESRAARRSEEDEGDGGGMRRGDRERGGDRDRGQRGPRDRDHRDQRDGGYREGRGRHGNGGGRGQGNRGDRERQPQERYQREESQQPPLREVRFYLGHGSQHGFSESVFRELVTEKSGTELSERVKRFAIRPWYAFVDFPQEDADRIIEAVRGATLPSGDTLIIERATVITTNRQEGKPSADEAGEAEDIDDESFESDDDVDSFEEDTE